MSKVPAPPTRGKTNYTFFIVAIAAAVVTTALTIFDAALMAKGAMLMAPDSSVIQLPYGITIDIIGGVAVCGAIVKAGWMEICRQFTATRMWIAAFVVAVLGVFLHTFSMVCTTGIAAVGRDAMVSARGSAQQDHTRAVATYEDARKRKAAAPATRPVAVIKVELTEAETDVATYQQRESAERASICGARCTEAIQKGETARKRRDGLKAELAIALEATKADADLAEASRHLKDLRAPEKRDPQAEALAGYLPWSAATVEQVGKMLPLIPSLVVEFGGPITAMIAGVFFGFAFYGNGKRSPLPKEKEREPSRPKQEASCPVLVHSNPDVDQRTTAMDQADITVVQPRRSNLAPEMVSTIRRLRAEGKSERAIAAVVNVPKTTVHRHLIADQSEASNAETDQDQKEGAVA